jgi:hypothetical protein
MTLTITVWMIVVAVQTLIVGAVYMFALGDAVEHEKLWRVFLGVLLAWITPVLIVALA